MTRGRRRPSSRSRGTLRRATGGLACLVVLLLTLLAPATSGYAASVAAYSRLPGGLAEATLTATTSTDPTILTLGAVTPMVAGPGVAVTISGSVTARTTALTAPTVRAVLGTTPIVSRDSVTAWATSTTALSGLEVASAPVPGPIAVGASASFTLSVPAGRFSLSRSFGAIPVALQVRDVASGTNETLRTFVGWQRAKQYEPMHLAIVAPVTLSPNAALFSTDPVARTAAWRTELDPAGRISRILDGTDVTGPAGPVPVTWAVDPAVLGPALTAGGQPDDPLTPLVAPLVTRLAAAVGRHTVWALPVADPDLAATVVVSPSDPTVAKQVQASTGLATALGGPVTTGVAWPADGSFEANREAGLRAAYQSTGLTAIIGSSSALPVVPGYSGQAPRRTASGVTLLAWDDELSRLATQTTSAEDGAVTGQRFLAETAALLEESPGVARSFLVALPRTLDPDPAALRQLLGTMAQTPWVQLVPSGDLQEQAATQDPVSSTSGGSWTAAGPAQVDAAQLARIEAQRKAVADVASVLGTNGTAYRTEWTTLLDQLLSVRWRQNPAQLALLDQAVTKGAVGATSGISVSEQTTNFLADEGTLQVTVVNSLDVPVDGVRLVLTPTNPRLRIVTQPDPVTIGAKSRAVVGVPAQALAAGLVPVTATLTTGDGTPLGAPGVITVRANPPGYAFYIVGGIVLALLLLLGIVRTIRRPRPPLLAPGTVQPSGGSTAAAPPMGGDRPVR